MVWEGGQPPYPDFTFAKNPNRYQSVAETLVEEVVQREMEEIVLDHHPVPFGWTDNIGIDGTGIPMLSHEC